MFFTISLSSSSIGSASLEVAIILIGAFILGYILSYEINKNKHAAQELGDASEKTSSSGINLYAKNNVTSPNNIHSAAASSLTHQPSNSFEQRTEQYTDDSLIDESLPDVTVHKNVAENETYGVTQREYSHKVHTDHSFLYDIKRDIKDIKHDIHTEKLSSEPESFVDDILDNKIDLSELDILGDETARDNNREDNHSTSDHKDDLTAIHGITEDIETALNKKNINSFQQLGFSNIYELKTILSDAGITPHYIESWPQQAKFAIDKKWKELKDYQHELVISQHH